MSAVYALGIIDHAYASLIIGNGTYGTGSFAGTLKMNDSAEGAGISTLSAFLALGGIDVHTELAGSYGIKGA